MKTEIIEQEYQTEWKFPCLGKHIVGELVVLFTGTGEGTILIQNNGHIGLGYYSEDWSMELFTPITEPTTIKFIP